MNTKAKKRVARKRLLRKLIRAAVEAMSIFIPAVILLAEFWMITVLAILLFE